MENIISLSTYKELKEAIELHKEVHGLILDNMLKRQSLIDNNEDFTELPKELQEFENCFDFTAVIRHQLGVAPNKKAFDQFAAAVDRYYFQNPNSSDFEVEYLIIPDEDEDDEWMERIYEETGRQLDLKAVADHVMGKERNVKAVEDFLWFLGKRDEEELDWN